MKKVIIGAALLALAGEAGATTVTLTAYNQRSSSGTLSTLKWSGCTTYTTTSACINPGNANLSAMGITPSTAVWDWNTQARAVHDGRLQLGLDTQQQRFHGGFGGDRRQGQQHGHRHREPHHHGQQLRLRGGPVPVPRGPTAVLISSLGDDGVLGSSAVYNVGGNANCVQRTLGGDDVSTGNPRTLMNTAGGGGCDAATAPSTPWTVVSDNLSTGGTLVISNGIPLGSAGTSYLTFVPVPAAAWLLAPAVFAAGRFSRRRKAA
ncbi:MAG: hypothetical protein U1F72_04200 [Gammaproteobacteria bacterium]